MYYIGLEGASATLSEESINWAELKISEICNQLGYGYVALFWHVKERKLD